ncbi:capsular biosynthesis protein [Clostridium aestuarii]|uniref:Capsular biosynthesis protein n=1 Tax=Clostridium aestuarii TaxID=338193 RepID=A0ABT4CX39_9CLOT|nr:capsular biosynthesis protein [Clostridium aestuarii]MCY6483555.1 capsular biosynthesis protein [Clostridium aestuarii]
MDINTQFKNKLSNLFFLQINKERAGCIFKTNIFEDIYMPIAAESIVNKIKDGENIESIPVVFFIEGMTYVLGADEKFKYNESYKKLIKTFPESEKFIKGRIAERIKDNKFEDAYIMLKGLNRIENNKEYYNKLIMLAESLRTKNEAYIEEELVVIDEAKSIENYAEPYFYEAHIKQEKGDYNGALFSINTYISKGGEETIEITEFKNSLKTIANYDEAKQLVYEEPEKALTILIPLLEELGDKAEIYFHIAVGYRILENYDKAIYYLEKSLEIDSFYPEVFNELGINYASLENFESAIHYFRKVFEATKSIEVCTNLVMCYLNIGDNKQAKIHLDIAKKIDPKDEILLELEEILKKA